MKFSSVLCLGVILLVSSCSSLNRGQQSELKEWQAQNLEVKEKQPELAAVLNILPGIGDFYNGNVGLGVLNLLTWPLSVVWAPVGGATGASEVNYYATKSQVERLENKRKLLKNELEVAYVARQISKHDYYFAAKKLDAMALEDFKKSPTLQDVMPSFSKDFERLPTSMPETSGSDPHKI